MSELPTSIQLCEAGHEPYCHVWEGTQCSVVIVRDGSMQTCAAPIRTLSAAPSTQEKTG